MNRRTIAVALVALGAAACAEDETPELVVPDTYSFESRFEPGSSVSYSGQTFRHILIDQIKAEIGDLTSRIDNPTDPYIPSPGDVVEALDFFYKFNGDTSGAETLSVTTTPGTSQGTYSDVSSGGASLTSKIAGKDPDGQRLNDWTAGMVGWTEDGVTTPESLMETWFEAVETLAIDRANSGAAEGPNGDISKAFVNAQGQDFQQLIQKVLLGAVAFSQGADDYLDDDFPTKGLLADNTVAVDGKPYTALEHAWDEGFGYFGAARDYGNYTDDEIADGVTKDTDGDGFIDLLSERNQGHSINAAKRDRGAADSAPTNMTQQAWDAFRTGRAIITQAGGALSEQQMADLKVQRDLALEAWEQAIAATAVHYINDVLQDMGKIGTDAYSFEIHAKHWSELKGFALSFQFSPHSALTAEQFAALHAALGQAPALSNDSESVRNGYKAELLTARTILRDAFGFADANMGDEDGEGGW